MRLRTLFFTLALAAGASAQTTVQEWRALALQKYPQLGVADSPLNKKFVEIYNARRTTAPNSLLEPRWPMNIADEANAALAPNAAPVASPMPAADSGPPKLTLRQNWSSKTSMSSGGGSATMADLKRLLGPHGKPSLEIGQLGDVNLYGGVKYLMSLRDAKNALGLGEKLASKTKIACAGFPDGLFYHAFDGRFDGRYNRLYIVTDVRDQVASIQMVDESPVLGIGLPSEDADWRTYNFVNARVKAKATMAIRHRITKSGSIATIDSEIYDPQKGKYVEVGRWIVPQPVIDAILLCVE